MLWHILAGHCDLSFYQAKHDVMAWQHTLIPLLEISWISPSRKALCMKASENKAQSMRPSRWGEKGSKHSGRCRMTVCNTLRQQSSGARCLSFSRPHLSLRFMGWSVFLHGERKRGLFCCVGELWDLAQAEFSRVLGQAAFTAPRFWKAGSYNANSWLGCGNARLMKSIVEDPLALRSWWPSEISMSLLTPKTRPFFVCGHQGGTESCGDWFRTFLCCAQLREKWRELMNRDTFSCDEVTELNLTLETPAVWRTLSASFDSRGFQSCLLAALCNKQHYLLSSCQCCLKWDE